MGVSPIPSKNSVWENSLSFGFLVLVAGAGFRVEAAETLVFDGAETEKRVTRKIGSWVVGNLVWGMGEGRKEEERHRDIETMERKQRQITLFL